MSISILNFVRHDGLYSEHAYNDVTSYSAYCLRYVYTIYYKISEIKSAFIAKNVF